MHDCLWASGAATTADADGAKSVPAMDADQKQQKEAFAEAAAATAAATEAASTAAAAEQARANRVAATTVSPGAAAATTTDIFGTPSARCCQCDGLGTKVMPEGCAVCDQCTCSHKMGSNPSHTAATAGGEEKARASRAAAMAKAAEVVAQQNSASVPAVATASCTSSQEASLVEEKQEDRKAQFKKGADPEAAKKDRASAAAELRKAERDDAGNARRAAATVGPIHIGSDVDDDLLASDDARIKAQFKEVNAGKVEDKQDAASTLFPGAVARTEPPVAHPEVSC